MRRLLALGFLLAAAGAQSSRRAPVLRNVEIVDREGVATSLAGFHLLGRDDLFRGFLGDASIEVPYARVQELDVRVPERPGGRMRVKLLLTTGKRIEATFDEREGDGIFQGFAWFGRLDVYFRDLRRVRLLGPTLREDLPSYGPSSDNIEVLVKDRQGVSTQLTRFRRAVGENVVSGILGASRVTIPLRLIKQLEIAPDKPSARGLAARAVLRGGRSLRFSLPPYEEQSVYRGRARFGAYRIHLGKVRSIEVTRLSFPLRELGPRDLSKIRHAGGTGKAEAEAKPAQDGKAQDGKAQDGKAQDGKAQDGKAQDGKTEDEPRR